jgi:virginiamycin B lyase
MKLAAAPLAVLLVGTVLTEPRPEVQARAPVEITEWTVPWPSTRPRDPAVDAQGRVWFVGQVGNYIARLDPKSGDFKRFELPAKALPHNLVLDAGGDVWYAGNGDAHIGRLDPRTGAVRRYAMPDSAARDPHTLVAAPNGDLWFTVQGGNFVGHLARETGRVRLVAVPTPRARP